MPFGRSFHIFPFVMIAAFAASAVSLPTRAAYAAGSYHGGAVAAHSYGGGYYRGGAAYASHSAAVASPSAGYVSHGTAGASYGAAYAPHGVVGVAPGAAVTVRGNYNAYHSNNVVHNYNYTGVYGGRTGCWHDGRWVANAGCYGGGVYVSGVVPAYGGVYYDVGTGTGAPTIVQAPDPNVYPAVPAQNVNPAAPGQNVNPAVPDQGVNLAPPPAAYPTPIVIYIATPSSPQSANMSGTMVTVVGQPSYQVSPDTEVVEARQVSYQDRKYYYYGGSYYQAHLQGADVGYHRVAAPQGISEPPADAPTTIITIATKE